MFHDVVGDVRDEDELNPPDVHPADSHRERPSRRKGANLNDYIYLYLRSIDNSLSRLDGHISSLDSRVSKIEENMIDMKAQLSTIQSLLQSMCKGSMVIDEMTRSPIPHTGDDATMSLIPPIDPDTTNTTASHTLIPPLEPPNTTTTPTHIPPLELDTTTSPTDVQPIEADVPHTQPDVSTSPIDIPHSEADTSDLLTIPHTEANTSDISEADTSNIVTTTQGVTLES
ncbi:uncharacterized protein LOC120074969 [Benincasa hispida]|uniref:uncharacterized protein LOC120074969 n=1 Tax=Benincasa hispida TaxID=102211 RepID=UPI0018FF1D60|nr:uncharacterized protein LOC120074969 [Benincasa hispida]